MQAIFFLILIDVNFRPTSQYLIEEVAVILRYDFFGKAKQSNSMSFGQPSDNKLERMGFKTCNFLPNISSILIILVLIISKFLIFKTLNSLAVKLYKRESFRKIGSKTYKAEIMMPLYRYGQTFS